MYTLFHGPGSCSLATWCALEEARLPYRIELVSTRNGEVTTPAHLARNPWGRVPALNIGDCILTENVAIQHFIAAQRPERQFLPAYGTVEHAQALAWLCLVSSTVHISFRPIFRPNRLASSEACQADVSATGLDALAEVFTTLETQLGDSEHVIDDHFTFCDSHLMVYTRWLERPPLAALQGRFANLKAHAARIAERPAIATVLEREAANF